MNRICSLLILIFVSQVKAETLCVQTFNVYGPIYAARLNERTRDLGDALAQEPECNIIQLQEAWNQSHQEKLTAIFEHLNFKVFKTGPDQKIGIMTAAKNEFSAPIVGIYRFNKSGIADQFRGWVGVKKGYFIHQAEINGEKILLMNTHLHNADATIRLAQLTELLQARLRFPESGVLLSGDFNAEPQSLEYEFLTQVFALKDSYVEVHKNYSGVCTYCERNPHSWLQGDHVFDYNFYSQSLRQKWVLSPISAKINLLDFKGRVLSDHYGVRTIFDWKDSRQVNSPDFIDKKAKALITLKKAIAFFRANNAAVYEDIISQLSHWVSDLETNQVNSNYFKVVMGFF